jgi:hypothetical protein
MLNKGLIHYSAEVNSQIENPVNFEKASESLLTLWDEGMDRLIQQVKDKSLSLVKNLQEPTTYISLTANDLSQLRLFTKQMIRPDTRLVLSIINDQNSEKEHYEEINSLLVDLKAPAVTFNLSHSDITE